MKNNHREGTAIHYYKIKQLFLIQDTIPPDFEKVEITTPTEASNPPSKVVGALVAVIVVIALIVVLLVFLLRNKEYVS